MKSEDVPGAAYPNEMRKFKFLSDSLIATVSTDHRNLPSIIFTFRDNFSVLENLFFGKNY